MPYWRAFVVECVTFCCTFPREQRFHCGAEVLFRKWLVAWSKTNCSQHPGVSGCWESTTTQDLPGFCSFTTDFKTTTSLTINNTDRSFADANVCQEQQTKTWWKHTKPVLWCTGNDCFWTSRNRYGQLFCYVNHPQKKQNFMTDELRAKAALPPLHGMSGVSMPDKYAKLESFGHSIWRLGSGKTAFRTSKNPELQSLKRLLIQKLKEIPQQIGPDTFQVGCLGLDAQKSEQSFIDWSILPVSCKIFSRRLSGYKASF